jgi:hypothetical protein
LTVNYNGSDANTPTIQSFANLGEATFPAPSNDTTTRSVDRSIHSIWVRHLFMRSLAHLANIPVAQQNSTGGAVVPWQYSLAITNGCSDGRIIVVTTIDANGTAQTISGPDDRVMTLPSLPLNVTVYFEDSPNDVTSISYFVVDALTYKVGAGSNREFLFILRFMGSQTRSKNRRCLQQPLTVRYFGATLIRGLISMCSYFR